MATLQRTARYARRAALVAVATTWQVEHSLGQSPYATELIAQNGAYGGVSLYNDPNSVLGEPTRIVNNNDPTIGTAPFHIKMVEPAYNRDLDGNKVITTLGRRDDGGSYTYGSITVKFDHPVRDDPVNPYGIDLNVFGNAFYIGTGFVSDRSDMRSYSITGGIFAEPVVVSVSPDNVNWYTYADGPFGDTDFPTQAYEWGAEQHDLMGNGWTGQEEMDFTKPVNPTLGPVLGTPGVWHPTADAIKMYDRSGGGTGIDLATSGFDWIQYVRVESTEDYLAGEIDALADVRPMLLGDSLSVTPANVAEGRQLYFQDPGDESRSAVIADFSNVADLGRLATAPVTDELALAALTGNVTLATFQLDVSALVSGAAIGFTADYRLQPGPDYQGGGSDLTVLSWVDDAWTPVNFRYDDAAEMAVLEDWSQASSILAITLAESGLSGDYDNDFDVDGADFLVWQRHLGNETTLPNEGASPNLVDGDDLAVWKEGFGQHAGGLQSVPEPNALWLAPLVVVVLRRRRLQEILL